MHVRLNIRHRHHPASITERLAARLGNSDPAVFDQSVVYVGDAREHLRSLLVYSSLSDTYRLIILRSGNSGLDAVLEETPHGRLPGAAETVWEDIRRSLKGLRPRLRLMTLNADMRDATILVGRRRIHVLRNEVLIPLAGLLLLVVYIWIASRTFNKTGWPIMVPSIIVPGVTAILLGGQGVRRAWRGSIWWDVADDVNAR